METTYRHKLDKMLKKAGRTRKWLYENSGIPQTSFWRKVNNNTMTDKEKKTINELLSK